MALTQDQVLEKLKNVVDPELFVNIVDLGLIYEVKFENPGESQAEPSAAEASPRETNDESANQTVSEIAQPATNSSDTSPEPTATVGNGEKVNVHIDMTMTSPACPAGPQLISGAKREVSALDGVADVEVRIVLDPPWTPDRMTEDAKDQLGIF